MEILHVVSERRPTERVLMLLFASAVSINQFAFNLMLVIRYLRPCFSIFIFFFVSLHSVTLGKIN